MKRMLLAMTILIAPAAALAQQERAPDRVDAVVRCLDVADPAARLACFDAAAAALRQGVQSGVVSVEQGDGRPRLVFPMSASVTAAASSDSGRWRLTLDNGQVWETEERQPSSSRPRAGTAIRIERGFLSTGYWLHLPGGGRYRVHRVG